jgi:hypothetical protein
MSSFIRCYVDIFLLLCFGWFDFFHYFLSRRCSAQLTNYTAFVPDKRLCTVATNVHVLPILVTEIFFPVTSRITKDCSQYAVKFLTHRTTPISYFN